MVDDSLAGAPFRDDADFLEFLQMAGNGRLAGRGEAAEVVDAAIAAAQRVQHQDAGRVGEGLQEIGAGFGLGGVHGINIYTYVYKSQAGFAVDLRRGSGNMGVAQRAPAGAAAGPPRSTK